MTGRRGHQALPKAWQAGPRPTVQSLVRHARVPISVSFFAVDLEQVWELDSLEYLEALECVTERLESRVNFCKAHLMMITCFDITSRRR